MTGLVIESIGSDFLIWPWLPAAPARRNMKRRLALAEWLILTGALRASLWRRDGLEQDEDEDDVFRRKLISEARMGQVASRFSKATSGTSLCAGALRESPIISQKTLRHPNVRWLIQKARKCRLYWLSTQVAIWKVRS